MARKLISHVWQEGEWFVAQCLEVDVASQGETYEMAIENLKEALALRFEPLNATVSPALSVVEMG